MKDIEKDKAYMEINGLISDLWNVYTCNDPDETNKTNRVWDLLAAFKNQTLETQALALEGMAAEALKYVGEAPGDNAVGSEQRAFGAASGFQQTADHLRAQKITE